jgi:hypothetical protein
MFNAHRLPVQTPAYLEQIAAALVAHGRTEAKAQALALLFIPTPNLFPEEQVSSFVKMEKALAAVGTEEDFMVLNFEQAATD